MRLALAAALPVAVLAMVAAPVLAQPAGTGWFSPNQSANRCIASRSPAAWIEDIQGMGDFAVVEQFGPAEAPTRVEVGVRLRSGNLQVWTYYRTRSDCEDGLPANQGIPNRYR